MNKKQLETIFDKIYERVEFHSRHFEVNFQFLVKVLLEEYGKEQFKDVEKLAEEIGR